MKPDSDKVFRPAALLNALPDALMAGTFVYAWLHPAAMGMEKTRGLVLLMLLEFVNMHSSFVMGQALISKDTRAARFRTALGYGAFYSVFVVAFAAIFKIWWPIAGFALLTANRLMILLPGQAPEGREKALLERSWVAGIVFYVLAAILSLGHWPSLGFTPDIVKAMGLPGEGAWVDTPQRAMVAGLIYFGLVAVSETFGHRWLKERTDLPAEKAQATRAPLLSTRPSTALELGTGLLSLMLPVMGWVLLITSVAFGIFGVWLVMHPDMNVNFNGVRTSAIGPKLLFLLAPVLFLGPGLFLVFRGGKVVRRLVSRANMPERPSPPSK